MYKFSQRSLTNLERIHPFLVKVMKTSIINSPVDFTITNGIRTLKEQQILYSKGRTTPGPKVTNADGIRYKSNHQLKADGYGYAVDLYPFYDGKVQVHDVQKLKLIASHIKKTAVSLNVKIEWGGDWKSFKDYPHFELKT